MSAYGSISRDTVMNAPLELKTYSLPNKSSMTLFPLRRETAPVGLIDYLCTVFNQVVEEGRTYPQLNQHTVEEFTNYFFSEDCFIGLLDDAFDSSSLIASLDGSYTRSKELTIFSVVGEKSWSESVLGFYYVKPNYPGRSSHLCNAGFIVPEINRGKAIGQNLGKSFLYIAPLLGYKGSVFNLVYVSNFASLKIWDSLNFQRVGLIPKAGRLKSKIKGAEDEFTDAVVYHKSF